MSYKISVSELNSDDKYKATLVGKNNQDGKFYFISTFNSEDEANDWLEDKTKKNNITQIVKSEVVENDGCVVVSGISDVDFETKEPEKKVNKTKSKPVKSRKFYENIWDAFKRVWKG